MKPRHAFPHFILFTHFSSLRFPYRFRHWWNNSLQDLWEITIKSQGNKLPEYAMYLNKSKCHHDFFLIIRTRFKRGWRGVFPKWKLLLSSLFKLSEPWELHLLNIPQVHGLSAMISALSFLSTLHSFKPVHTRILLPLPQHFPLQATPTHT